jgi:hypothetical protein
VRERRERGDGRGRQTIESTGRKNKEEEEEEEEEKEEEEEDEEEEESNQQSSHEDMHDINRPRGFEADQTGDEGH